MSETTIDKSNERVEKMFGEIAPSYDRMNHLLSMHVDRYWRMRTIGILKPDTSGPILDVCTGTGDLALAFWKKMRGQVKVTATDFCEPMLKIGREKAARRGAADQVEFIRADTQDLPLDSDQFQIVSVAFGLRNVENTEKGLAEMTRVCRPGGQVALLEFSTPRRQPFRSVYLWYFKNILPRIGQTLAKNVSSAYEYLPESVCEFPAYEALAVKMTDAGLENVKFYPLTTGIATLYVGRKSG